MDYRRYWHMREGGPKEKHPDEVFKCTDCGAVTRHRAGWNGEPDTHRCSPECRCGHGDWSPGQVSGSYKAGYDRIRWIGAPTAADAATEPGAPVDHYRQNYDRIFRGAGR